MMCPLIYIAAKSSAMHAITSTDIACREDACAWWTGAHCAITEIGLHMVDLADAADREVIRTEQAENVELYKS
jgi:hypothetical protein